MKNQVAEVDVHLNDAGSFQFSLALHSAKPPSDSDDEDEFYCNICTCKYRYEFSLKRHYLKSHINRAYIQTSDLSSFGISASGHHKATSSEVKLFSCNACQKLYSKPNELVKHIKENHQVFIEGKKSQPVSPSKSRSSTKSSSATEVIIRCPECKAEFNNMRSLNCHSRSHKNVCWNSPPQVSPSSVVTSSSHRLRLKAKAIETKTKAIQARAMAATTKATQSEVKDIASGSAEPFQRRSTDNTFDSDKDDATEEKRQLRQRTLTQQASYFRCTICHKLFHSYGNMMRHRRLTHESVIKKKPAISFTKQLKKRLKKSKFCDPKTARKYYNKVADNIAFNMKNCLHGNVKHLESSAHYVKTESQTSMEDVKPRVPLGKLWLNQLNIRTVAVKSLLSKVSTADSTRSDADKRLSKSKKSSSEISETSEKDLTKAATTERKLEVYEQPGLWKFLCTICMQYFTNTLELFTHQDTVHKRVKTSHIEIAKDHELPLHALSNQSAIGYIKPANNSYVIADPNKYTCTKCKKQFETSLELHPHLLECGKNVLEPISIQIPPVYPTTSADDEYGKVKSKKKGHWHRGSLTHTDSQQLKITDIFNVKKRKSRLEVEVEEQMRLEYKIRLAEALSPNQSSIALQPEQKLDHFKQLAANHNKDGYSCPYCSLTFKYRKVYMKHVETRCEMVKRLSPNKLEEEQLADFHQTKQETQAAAQLPESRAILESGDMKAETHTNTLLQPSTSSSSIPEEFLSPQKSLTQARVLAKFIHSARACGPCYTCKKPNMARRYSHLQQRSASFREFVMAKYKTISLQSCICKACELKFRSAYEKLKNKPAKLYTLPKKPSKTGVYLKNSRNLGADKSNTFSNMAQRTKANGIKVTDQSDTLPVRNIQSRNSNASISSRTKRYTSRHKAKTHSQKNISHTKNSSSTTIQQIKSMSKENLSTTEHAVDHDEKKKRTLEQIFPLGTGFDFSDNQDSLDRQYNSSSYKSSRKSSLPRKRSMYTEDYIEIEENFAHGEDLPKKVDSEIFNQTNMPLSVDTKSLELGSNMISPRQQVVPPAIGSPRKRFQASIDLPEVGPLKKIEESDARLQVILQFVGNSPGKPGLQTGRKSSLTEIIDAVTQKVKDDPSLAKKLTDAINAAVSNGKVTPHNSPATRKAINARGSRSLPAMLEGLTGKLKDHKFNGDKVKSKDVIKVQPISKMAASYTSATKSDSPVSNESSLHNADSSKSSHASSATSNGSLSKRNRRRKSVDANGQEFITPKKPLIMSDESCGRMVDVIDSVAKGLLGPTTIVSLSQSKGDSSNKTTDNSDVSHDAMHEYDFLSNSYDKLDCIRVHSPLSQAEKIKNNGGVHSLEGNPPADQQAHLLSSSDLHIHSGTCCSKVVSSYKD